MTGVVAVTASAAIDRTYRTGAFARGAVNRAETVHEELSGKGVNVAQALVAAGVNTRSVVPLGDAEMTRFAGAGAAGAGAVGAGAGASSESAASLVPIRVSRSVRINISVLEPDGTSTKINQQPEPLSISEWDALVAQALSSLDEVGGGWLALCGSLPTIAETGATVPFEDLVARARQTGARVAVDVSGAPLRRLCAGDVPVDLIKPNTHELAEAVGRELRTVGDVVDAAERVRARGVETVYVSMGEDGALVVGADGYRHAIATAPALVNTVGAGDASLAGFLSCMVGDEGAGQDPAQPSLSPLSSSMLDAAASRAAEWGALAVSQATTILTDPESAPRARLSRPSLDTVLAEPGLLPA